MSPADRTLGGLSAGGIQSSRELQQQCVFVDGISLLHGDALNNACER